MARDNFAFDRIRTPQQPARQRHLARSDAPPDLAGRYDQPAQLHRLHDAGFESVALAELGEHAGIAGLLVAEAEILADHHHPRSQLVSHVARRRIPPASVWAISGVKFRTKICSIPSSRILAQRSSSEISGRGARSGATTQAGCGSKVIAAGCRPRSAASDTTCANK